MGEMTFADYSNSLFGDEDELLRTLRAEASGAGLPAIQVPPDLARLLAILAMNSRNGRVLEIGALFGYSTITMARALPTGGKLTTLELEASRADMVRSNAARAGIGERVEVIVGPALESLARLEGRVFDLVFIDADKTGYPQYLEWALKLTEPGSIIVADNVWRQGDVLNPDPDDDGTRAIAAFNQALAANPNLISTLISTRGGDDAASLSIVRR